MSKRRLYDENIKKTLDNATTFTIKGREVKRGWILFVTHACPEDETNPPTAIAFGKYEGDTFIALEELDSPMAGRRAMTEKTHHFTEGQMPAWRVEGGTVSDVITGHNEGYYEKAD